MSTDRISRSGSPSRVRAVTVDIRLREGQERLLATFGDANSQSEYIVDGQTIADAARVTFSNSVDPGIAKGIYVIYGECRAKFFEKIGAVSVSAQR